MKKNMYSTQEVANILHLSRVEIFRKIKSGKIKAEKIGRNYVIPYESIEEILGETIGTHKRTEIEKVIDKALKEYGEVFNKLSKE
ncbi:MAG: helix-turn-helix domain-containing protein [Candidatus Pacebacteria bacterium]|nr:helix-turn-helix domain-containing protein [Candidatus Paceibacterota bacterium]MCF7862833.1 helix-turn-helix domain-containing protein [Candidatus Paceibacterota bacterium]